MLGGASAAPSRQQREPLPSSFPAADAAAAAAAADAPLFPSAAITPRSALPGGSSARQASRSCRTPGASAPGRARAFGWPALCRCVAAGRPAFRICPGDVGGGCRVPSSVRFYIVPSLCSFGDLREGCDSAIRPESEFREAGDTGGDSSGGSEAWECPSLTGDWACRPVRE